MLAELADIVEAASPGAALLAELRALRELASDVRRWRESGDVRELAYVLETLDKLSAE
jgi:hypothetical protein